MAFVPTIVSSRDLPLPGERNDPPYSQDFLRVVHGGADDPARKFMVAYHAASLARAEYDLAGALAQRDHWLGRSARIDEDPDPHGVHTALYRMREAIVTLACVPACDKAQLLRKKRMIGKVWLKAEGDFYEGLRARVAADEARLGAQREA